MHLQLSADTHERTAVPACGRAHCTSCNVQADAEQPATPRRSSSPADPATRAERVVAVTWDKESKRGAIAVIESKASKNNSHSK